MLNLNKPTIDLFALFKSKSITTNIKTLKNSFQIIFQNHNFCFKFIPVKKLKMIKIDNETASLIYQQDPKPLNKNAFKLHNTIKPLSLGILLTLIIHPNLYISYILNIILQPLLINHYINNNKKLSCLIFSLYLLKNGQQILIITHDFSSHIINIKEIINTENDKVNQQYFITTPDKKFILKQNKNSISNEDILFAIKDGRFIDTKNCLTYYNRYTYPK